MSAAPHWLMEFPPPTFVIAGLRDSEFADSFARWEAQTPGLVMRVCRGRKMRNVRGLYDEFAAAWQFPWYFGENADAFWDCISDLSWLPAKAYLVCLKEAAEILAEEPETAFARFFKLLEVAARVWGNLEDNRTSLGWSSTPFHVLLQVGPGDVERMKARLDTGGFQSRLL